MNKEDELMRKRLLEKFPDGNTKNITKLRFYDEFNAIRKKSDIDIKTYIVEKLGLNYSHKNIKFSIENLKDNLLEFYPDKIIESLGKFHEDYQGLYLSMRDYCDKHNINTIEYLNREGFTLNNRKYVSKDYVYSGNQNDSEVTYSEFDVFTLKRINDDYACNSTRLAKRVNLNSKQSLSNRLKVKKINPPSWHKEEFEEEEVNFIISAIENRETEVEDEVNNIFMNIYFGRENKEDISILIKNKGKFKCHFNFNGIIREKLEEYGYFLYYEKDFVILSKIYSLNEDCEDLILTNAHLRKYTTLANKIRMRCLGLDISIEEYLKIMNVEFLKEKANTPIVYTEERIISVLEKFSDKDKFVSIPSKDKMYTKLRMIALRRGYASYLDMLAKLGFKHRRRQRSEEQIKEDYIKIITDRYTVSGNKIYMNSLDNLYSSMTSYCIKRNIKLDDYLAFLGFERISSQKELPTDYVPFDWKTEQCKKLLNTNTDEKIELLIEELSDENNTVYIDIESRAYDYLNKICNIRDITLNELVEVYGFTRVYKSRVHRNVDGMIDDSYAVEEERRRIQDCLAKLRELQNNRTTTVIITEKENRNYSLVTYLKKLYNRKCQMCATDGEGFKLPIILDDKGREYVEMHHIQDLADNENEETDDVNLDNFQNGIVLCCFHHKYVHKHLGGYRRLVRDKDFNCYLQSESGDRLRIYTNEHLETDDEVEV